MAKQRRICVGMSTELWDALAEAIDEMQADTGIRVSEASMVAAMVGLGLRWRKLQRDGGAVAELLSGALAAMPAPGQSP